MILPTSWPLPDSIKIRLGKNTYGRQRAIFEEGNLLLVLHRPPEADQRVRTGVLFWRTPKGEWHWSHGGTGTAPLQRHLQSYAELEAKLAEDFDRATHAAALFDLLDKLTPLTRSARNLHQALQSAREAIKGDPFLIELRDQSYEIERNFELLIEDVRNALHYRTALEAEQQAARDREALAASHRLNLLVALFLPLSAVGGLFGMNLRHGFEGASAGLFWIVFVGSVSLGFFMRGWITRRH